MRIIEAGEQLLIFERAGGGERLRCTFNLSGRPATVTPKGKMLISNGDIDGARLGAYAALVEEIE
jgi:hypothetical protein